MFSRSHFPTSGSSGFCQRLKFSVKMALEKLGDPKIVWWVRQITAGIVVQNILLSRFGGHYFGISINLC